MNIYAVNRTCPHDYDEFDSFVVVCGTELEARHTHPRGWAVWSPEKGAWIDREGDVDEYHGWVADVENLMVVHIGVALPNAEPGIVVASFNAG